MICPKCGGNVVPQDDSLLVCQGCGSRFVRKSAEQHDESSEKTTQKRNDELQELKLRLAEMERKQSVLEDEIAKTKNAAKTNGSVGAGKSGFSATVSELFAEKLLLLWVSLITLGFAYPWLKCHYEGFIASKTYVKGRRLSFDGKGKDLAKKYYLWMLLSVVTLGIYSIFLADKLHKWVIEHTHYDGNEGAESSYNGKTGVIFGFKLATFFAGLFTLGIAKPFVECKRENYLCEHTIIDGSQLYFDGSGAGLLKKQVLWVALTIATCGVYALWLNLQKQQWLCANLSNDSVDLDVISTATITPEEKMRLAEEKRQQQEQERAQRALEKQQQRERRKELRKAPQFKLSSALFAVATILFATALSLMIAMLVEGPLEWFEPSIKVLIAFEVIFSVATAAMMAGCIVCSKKVQRKALTIAAIVLIVCSVGTMSAGFYGSSQAVKYSNVDPFFYYLQEDGTYSVSFDRYENSESDDFEMEYAKECAIANLTGNLVIPSNYNGIPITSIGGLWEAFADHSHYSTYDNNDISKNNEKITSITIPDTIKTIQSGAFEDLCGITEITIPASVEKVGFGAFENCKNLTTVNWDAIASICTKVGTGNYYDSSIFSGCTKLTNIIIGENVTTIPAHAFSDCIGLTSIVIPNKVTSIGNYAFSDCIGLTNVTIPDSVTSIGNAVFSGCTNLRTVYYGGTKAQWGNISKGENNGDLIYATRIYVDGTKENTETGTSFDDAITLLPGCRYTVNITTGGQVVYFKFVPTRSVYYCIESSTGYPGKQGTLYDSSRSYLRSDDGYIYGSSYYFSIRYSFTAGNTYYVAVKFNSSSTTGSFTVQFS